MTPEATDGQIAQVKQRLESIERLHVLAPPGELTTAIGAIGDPEGVAELGLEGMPGGDRVVPISGNKAVMLCERGIRTFETATRFTLDLSAIPWLKLHTHLPVIVDPSHAAGDRRLVAPLSRAAAAVGADGLPMEIAEDPAAALYDGPQQLAASDFAQYAQEIAAHAVLTGERLA